LGVAAEHLRHQGGLVRDDLVAGPGFRGLADVPVAERGTGQHVHAAGLRPPGLAAPVALHQLGLLVCSANMPWNWTSSWSSGLSPRGPFTNSTRTPQRASSSIGSAW